MEQKVKVTKEERKEEVEQLKQEALVNWELSPEMQAQLEKMEVQEKEVEVKLNEVSKEIA